MKALINGVSATLYEDCACGCGGLTRSPEATWIPGHDQKWVGKMAHKVLVARTTGDQFMEMRVSNEIKLRSGALQAKVWGKVAKDWAKVTKKVQKSNNTVAALDDLIQAIDDVATLTVKVGRWEYPAKVNNKGLVLRNTKRDGTGDWIRHQEERVA